MKKLKKEEQRKMKLVQCKLKYAPTPYDCNHHLKEKREKEAFFLFFFYFFFPLRTCSQAGARTIRSH